MGTYNDENPTPLGGSGWTTVLFDGFNSDSVNRDLWPVVYGGSSGNGGAYQWSNDDVHVGGGELTVSMTNHGGWWSAGGLSQGWEGETYGRFEVRAKVDPGQGTSTAILLWPTDNGWPPELDLLETPTASRDQAYFTHHWDGGGGSDRYTSTGFGVDATQWHTYALDWSADRLTYYIDDRQMHTTTEHVPHEPMALAFMGYVATAGQNWYGGGPDWSTPQQVSLHVDWARISTGGGGGGWTAPAQSAPAESAPALGGEWAGGGATDWNALAAQVTANHEASGGWFA
jgi:beta-glucanase (GH16 family)